MMQSRENKIYFYSIISSINGDFTVAAISILIAMMWDTLDGRVARLTNTQSAFGAEYDSLADLVSFGIAPALLVYQWSLYELGRFGSSILRPHRRCVGFIDLYTI